MRMRCSGWMQFFPLATEKKVSRLGNGILSFSFMHHAFFHASCGSAGSAVSIGMLLLMGLVRKMPRCVLGN